MNTQHYTATLTVDQTPEQVFAAITNLRGWWSEEIDGRTDKLGAEFTIECYADCSGAWGSSVDDSLRRLITTGKARPNRKETGTNRNQR